MISPSWPRTRSSGPGSPARRRPRPCSTPGTSSGLRARRGRGPALDRYRGPDGDLRSMLSLYGAPSVPVAIDLSSRSPTVWPTRTRPARPPRHQAGQRAAASSRRRRAHRLPRRLRHRPPGRRRGDPHLARDRRHAQLHGTELHTGGQPGVESDVYSLGCLLWATLTGRAPYVGTSDFEIVTAHREKPVPLPDDSPLAGRLNGPAQHPGQGPGRTTALGGRGPRLAPLAAGARRADDPSRPPRRGGLLAVVLVAGRCGRRPERGLRRDQG